jgi:hypothetical protein
MKITNYRIGFAANSSSTHSCVVVPKDTLIKDHCNTGEYRWDYFTLASPAEKTLYLLCQLVTNIKAGIHIDGLSWEQSSKLNDYALAELGLLPTNLIELYKQNTDAYVDHQSAITFPRNKEGLVDIDFASKFIEHIANNSNVAILGGNDNDDYSHPLDGNPDHYLFDSISNFDKVVKLADNHFTLFNTRDGSKMRVTFDDSPITSSPFPELVDMKITDWCDKGCTFCYQSSTTEGVHAKDYLIREYVTELAQLGTLEIALGGGETTAHPDFAYIISTIYSKGIVPNFTTKSTSWFTKDWAEGVIKKVGAIAYSVGSLAELRSVRKEYLSHFSSYTRKFTIHIVMGTVNKSSLIEILDYCKKNFISFTLLGYKDVGFGETYNMIPYLNWMEDIITTYKEFKIDSLLAKEIAPLLNKHNVDPIYYYVTEGSFSCYIDATQKYLSKDSYSPDDKLDIKYARNILELYQQMQSNNLIN